MNSKSIQTDCGTKPYKSAFQRKKRMAFVTTSLAMFCLLCLIGSLSINSFETTAFLDISTSGQDPNAYFEQIIDSEVSNDTQLSKHLLAAANQSLKVDNQDIAKLDLNRVRQALDFRIAPRREGNQFRLTAAFVGPGTEADQNLIRTVVNGLANRLGSPESAEQTARLVAERFRLIQNAIEKDAVALQDDLELANRGIDNINLELSDVFEAVELLGPELELSGQSPDTKNIAADSEDRAQITTLLDSLQNNLDELELSEGKNELTELGLSISRITNQLNSLNSPTATNSSQAIRIINAAVPRNNTPVKSVLDKLGSLDTDSIQTKINQIQDNNRTKTIQMRENVIELQLLSDKLTDSRFVVNSIGEIRTQPAGANPGIGNIFLFGLLSVGIGAAISIYYRPEFCDMGFQSAKSAEQTLGIPVITSLGVTGDSEDNKTLKNCFANSLVSFCEVGLFAFLLLTVVLCFTQPEIRTAFFENPFYGLIKMTKLFF